MKVLGLYGVVGWSIDDGWLHSAGASLWIDGQHAYTISEERVSRDKHDGRYPNMAIDYVLDSANLEHKDIDLVVYAENIHSPPLTGKIEQILEREFEEAEIEFVDHHRAHAEASFYTSPWKNASILSIDGAGSSFQSVNCGSGGCSTVYETGLYAVGDKDCKQIITLFHSKNGFDPRMTFNVGQIYNNISRYLYARMEPEKAEKLTNPYIFMETAPGKIMGLAGYGNHEKVDLPHLFEVKEDSFYFPAIVDADRMPSEKEMGKYDEADIAAWLQYQYETILIDFFSKLPKKLKEPYLCLAGGCGLNVLANRKLIDQNIFEDIHIFPATNDSGLCFGAALGQVVRNEKEYEIPENLAYLGYEYSDDEILEAIKNG